MTDANANGLRDVQEGLASAGDLDSDGVIDLDDELLRVATIVIGG